MIVVSDTTPINYLVLVGKQDILPLLFGQVIVPEAVLEAAAERGLLDFGLVLAELKTHKFFLSPALERDSLERDARRQASRKKPSE